MSIDIFMVSVRCNVSGETDTKLFFRKNPAYRFFNEMADFYCYPSFNDIHRDEDFIWIAYAGGSSCDYTITLNAQELCL